MTPMDRILDVNERKDQREYCERIWERGRQAPKPQAPCDIGLFSDESSQLDLVEMFMEPT